MKKFNWIFSIIVSLPFFLYSCEEAVKGCTDYKALNRNYDATEDDGSCSYSKIVFYQQFSTFSGVPITKVEVFVDGSLLGTTSAIYPTEPGNCSAFGTLKYQFADGNKIDWNSKVYLQNGTVLLGSGSQTPSSISDCLKVNVTQ